jgi:hypothetical protein
VITYNVLTAMKRLVLLPDYALARILPPCSR